MQQDGSHTTSTDIRWDRDLSWEERKEAGRSWRFRVERLTRSQRRARVARLILYRKKLLSGEWVPLITTGPYADPSESGS